MDDLNFSVIARLGMRGITTFVAEREGQRITSERFAPGDGNQRRKVAERWANDERLRDGSPIPAEDIERLLEQAELAAMEATDRDDSDVGDDAVGTPLASFVGDGQLVELAWNDAAGRPDYILFDRQAGETSRADTADTVIGLIEPPVMAKGIVTPGGVIPGAILLPTDAVPIDEDRLRAALTQFINRYVELPGDSLSIAVEYVLLTWVHDAFDELPYLAFRTADLGRGKSRALEVVGSVCYRPMFIGGGSSSAATLRLLDAFGGTLVADEFDQGHNTELAADLNRILNQGFQKNRPLLKCCGEDNTPRPFACFGPKIFALRKRLGDDATESRTISVLMKQRTRRDIPLSLPRARFSEEALALRNHLLAWRFANVSQIKVQPDLASADLEDRYNQIGGPLLAVARTDESRARIIRALREQQGSVAVERGESLPGEVFAAVLATADDGVIRPGAVAQEVNRVRAAADGIGIDHLSARHRLTSQKIGKVLRGELELVRLDGRDREGARYRLTPDRKAQLCQRFGGTPPVTSQTSQRHNDTNDTQEKPLFDAASRVCDDGVVGDVTPGVGDVGGDDAERHAPESVIPSGWTGEGWAHNLRRMAACCQDAHPEQADTYRRWATTIEKNSIDKYPDTDIIERAQPRVNP